MLRASLRKIKSAPKFAVLLLLGGLVVVVLGVGLALPHRRQPEQSIDRLTVGRFHYTLEVATTAADQEKGLGDRSMMSRDHGMVFPFMTESQQCIWMKDMRFPIDMIWVDSAKKVTHVERNVSPATYPRTYCFDGQYVIELNADEAARTHLHTGQHLTF
jgi:uncharacterized membrane protein (UPF0127 family)